MLNIPVHIGIAGAGIAGLVTGLELQRAGYSVSIYESRSRCGGRIKSFYLDGILIECGPEFIHGELKETIRLLKKYHIPFVAADGEMYRSAGGKLERTFEMADGWDDLLLKMRSIPDDMPYTEFLEKYFSGQRFEELRKAAIRFAEGFDLADTTTCSTKALIYEWEGAQSEQYRIPSGYSTLIRALKNEFQNLGGKIWLNHPIERVDWHSKKVSIYVTGHQKIDLEKLVICLPLGVLNHADTGSEEIIFSPDIPEKRAAFSDIGFGRVIKIIMIWEKPFWKDLITDGQFVLSDQFIPTWWTQYPLDIPMLTGWLGGPKALEFAESSEAFFREKAIESLAAVFSLSEEKIKDGLKQCQVFNWNKAKWSRGAYSYGRVGFRNTKTAAKRPLKNSVFFSGEAYYDGLYPGTVEAAIADALKTVNQILDTDEPDV